MPKGPARIKMPDPATGGRSLEFVHPVDIGDEWKQTLCTDCHATSIK